jgi:hypothetical protein
MAVAAKGDADCSLTTAVVKGDYHHRLPHAPVVVCHRDPHIIGQLAFRQR